MSKITEYVVVACDSVTMARITAERDEALREAEELNGAIERLTRDKDQLLTKDDGDYLRERLAESAAMDGELKAARAEIEALRKQCAEPVRKVKLPERYWHHDVGHFYDSEEVIASLKSANYAIGPCDCGRGKPVRKVKLPDGLAAFSPHVKTEYANGWNTFRERLVIALKAANVEIEP